MPSSSFSDLTENYFKFLQSTPRLITAKLSYEEHTRNHMTGSWVASGALGLNYHHPLLKSRPGQ